MLQPLQESINKGGFEVELEGTLDESAELPAVPAKYTAVTIDLKKLKSINSEGVRLWVLWMSKEIAPRKPKIYNCPRCFIEAYNIIGNFLKWPESIISFEVPYHCEGCNNVDYKIFERPPIKFIRDIPTTMACNKCRKVATIDVIENRYFRFLEEESDETRNF